MLILHDIRSIHNVGSMIRTAECFGLRSVYFTGYTPYPKLSGDTRLPHISEKIHNTLIKTSLGAEKNLELTYVEDIYELMTMLKRSNIRIVAAEQNPKSIPLRQYKYSGDSALLVGREVEGIDPKLLAACDDIVEIPMMGQKESFNVSVAAGIILYELTN